MFRYGVLCSFCVVIIAMAQSPDLKPCPDSPNCVSSQAPVSDQEHYIAPLSFEGEAEDALATLVSIIEDMPRSRIEQHDSLYLHATFRSRIFRFVDDLELIIDDVQKLIHLRSAARMGYGDFGVNRRRVEEIKAAFVK